MRLFRFGADVPGVPTNAQVAILFGRCADVVVEHDARAVRTRAWFHRLAPSVADAVVSGVRDLDEAGLVAVWVFADVERCTAAEAAVFEAVNLALRLRGLTPRVHRMAAIRSLLVG